MNRKLISKRMLTLFLAVVLMSSLFMTFATPVSAIPDCVNPDCLNPEITVCAGTTFNDTLLTTNGVGCDPVPGNYLPDTDDEYNITVDFNFIQNADPFGAGDDLEGDTPGPGTYYYHVYCTKDRVFYEDSCSCASVGYIYVEECVCSADDITGLCVGDTVLTPAQLESQGNVSCTGEECVLTSIDHPVGTATYESPISYPYTVYCDSPTCGEVTTTADVIVDPCEEACECYAPDVTICQGDDVTAAIMAADPLPSCTGGDCDMTLDVSGVNNMVPDVYSYTVYCDTSASCQGTVTVEPACVATAPDFDVCQFETDLAGKAAIAFAGCSTGCDPAWNFDAVDTCVPDCYPYSVTCTDACGSECGDDYAEGTICVLPDVDVEIIEAAGYENNDDGWVEDSCLPSTEERMIVPVSSYFGVKAVIENDSGCLLYNVTPYITWTGNLELIDATNYYDLGNMEGGADADSTEVAWTLHCLGEGPASVTVWVNDCAMDTVCFDQRIPGELVIDYCDSDCEVCVNCASETWNDIDVNASVTNIGQTKITEAQAVIKVTGPATVTSPLIIDLDEVIPGETVPLHWDAICTGEGTATFEITVTGYDICGNQWITPLVCTTDTFQRNVLVDVCVEPQVGGTCTPSCDDNAVVSTLQFFDVKATVRNCTETQTDMTATLILPAGTQLVSGSLTVPLTSVCPCCCAYPEWHLQCIAPTDGPVPVEVVVDAFGKTYSNFPCEPATVEQEEKVHLSAAMGPFVLDCDTDCMIPIEVVAECQDFDVKIWVTNSGQATAEDVMLNIVVEDSVTTDCHGIYNNVKFIDDPANGGNNDQDIPGYSTEWAWLSELIEFGELCHCIAEGDVIITITNLTATDENTCEPVLVENVEEPCPLVIPQCDIDVDIINPETCTNIEQWEVFAVKARIDNCGDCSFEDVAVTLMWEGAVELVAGSVKTVIIPVIEAPDEDCEELCRFEEVTWMLRCVGAPNEVYLDVCVEAATPHLQIKSPVDEAFGHTVNVHQEPRDQALVCVDILSPDTGSKYATSEEFAITAKITNLECCAPITIDSATIDIGGIPWQVDNIEVSDLMPPLPWVIQPGASKIVTWTAHCTGSGLSWFNVVIMGESAEYEPVYVVSDPVSVWQYPAAHLEVTIDEYPEVPIVTSTEFDVTYTVTNTGEADATEVYATLSVVPEGSVRIAGPSDGGYTQYLGTIPGHGSEASSVTRTFTLHCKLPCDSTIKITVGGNDEYGWHMKQQCASTGSFVIEGGIEMVEGLTQGFPDTIPGGLTDKGWFAGLFYGDANGLFGPFNATSPVSWAAMGGGPDYTGEVALMGAVIPNVSLVTAEMLAQYMCSCGDCLYNPDCGCDFLCELIKGRDVMVFIGHITSDTPFDELPDTQEFFWVHGGLLQIINGQLSGSYIKGSCDMGVWVKSLLGGEYCTNMAATAGIPILAGFIEPDEVTVKQLPMLADLDIDKEVDLSSCQMGDTVVFTVTLDNLGPSDATSVLVMDVLPAGLSYQGDVPSQGWYDVTSGYWAVGDLAADAAPVTLVITAVVNTVGDVCNRATVVALDEHDPVTTNNMDEACVDAGEPDAVDSVPLSLDLGQNLISLPLMPDVTDPVTVLLGVDFDLASMMEGSSKTSFSWEAYLKGVPPAAGFVWEDGYGYWMNVLSSGETLVIAGEELPEAGMPPSYDVAGGWNLIGFKSTTSKLPAVYLAGIEGMYVMIYGYDNGAFYAVGSPGHAMLEPGYGYWLAIKVGESGTIFP